MATNSFFSSRIPQGLYDRIEDYRKEKELSTLANKERKQDTKQLTTNTDNKAITYDNKADDSFDKIMITNDNNKQRQILSTREVLELVEISQSGREPR